MLSVALVLDATGYTDVQNTTHLPGDFIKATTDSATDFDFIPRLGSSFYTFHNPANGQTIHPVKTSVAGANLSWGAGGSWVGGVAPVAGDRVVVPLGSSVIYNLANSAPADIYTLEIGGTLTLDNSASRTLKVGTIYVLPQDALHGQTTAGELQIVFADSSKTANIIFTDMGWAAGNEVTAFDPKHFSGGLVAYGKVNIQGAAHTTTTSGAAGDWAYATGSLTKAAAGAATSASPAR